MAPFQVQLKTTSRTRGIETYDAESWVGELWGVRELEAVSCFFGIDWLDDVRRRLARSAKLILHLNRPPSGSRQMVELAEFLERAQERGPTEIYLHTGPKGLFHSKLYVLRRESETTTYVGSSNATGPAFGGNEEILLKVDGVYSPMGVDDYLESLRANGEPLDSGFSKLSLEHFFREARLVFRPTRADPFRMQLPPVLEPLEASARARGLVFPKTGAAFSLWAAVELDDSSGDVGDGKDTSQVTAALRPRAIETTYGFWVPVPYFKELSPVFAAAAAKKIERLEELGNKLDQRETRVRTQFAEALREVQVRGRKPLTADALARKEQAFENLLELSRRRLGDSEWVKAHAKRLYDAVVPDLFSDPESRSAFLGSFTYDLALRLDDPGRMRPRIVKAFAVGLKRWADPSTLRRKNAFSDEAWFVEALESMLQADGFTTGDLWGVELEEEDE